MFSNILFISVKSYNSCCWIPRKCTWAQAGIPMEYEQDQETLKKIRDVIVHLDLPLAILPQDFHALKKEVNDRLDRFEGMLYQITNLKKETRAEQRTKGRRLQFQSTIMECSSPQIHSSLSTPQIYSFHDSPGSNIAPSYEVSISPKVAPNHPELPFTCNLTLKRE